MKYAPLSLLLSLSLLSASAAAQSWVYVSNATGASITAYTLDQQQGKLQPMGRYATPPNPMSSVVSPDHSQLYVMVRSKPFHVMRWKIQPDGKLTALDSTPLPESMAYLSLDKTGRYLLGASYGGDLFSINRVDRQGHVEAAPVQVTPTGKRAHAIQTSPDNRFLYVTQLGTDQVLQYRFDEKTGKAVPNDPPFINISKEAVTGPRHFVFAPQRDKQGRQNLYVLNEMGGNINQLTLNANGTLQAEQEVQSVDPEIAAGMQRGEAHPLAGDGALPPSPKPRIWQADIHMTPDGQYLYSSERTSSTLSAFRVSPENGHLTFIQSVKTEQQPRGFAIDKSGRFLIASGEKSQQLSLYRIDANSGKLALAQQVPTDAGANWVTLVEE
ncbi:6-phosphogluconolactonase [Enterobacterales bacterium CwR94]|nr:6-phosphogluconolactonase [Enterobacterales bacterium CwR94]